MCIFCANNFFHRKKIFSTINLDSFGVSFGFEYFACYTKVLVITIHPKTKLKIRNKNLVILTIWFIFIQMRNEMYDVYAKYAI
jgi:hypothetical protein